MQTLLVQNYATFVHITCSPLIGIIGTQFGNEVNTILGGMSQQMPNSCRWLVGKVKVHTPRLTLYED